MKSTITYHNAERWLPPNRRAPISASVMRYLGVCPNGMARKALVILVASECGNVPIGSVRTVLGYMLRAGSIRNNKGVMEIVA